MEQGLAADSSGAVRGHLMKCNAAGATRCSPLEVFAGGWGSWGERFGSVTNLLRCQPVLESVLELDKAAPQPGPCRCLLLALGTGGLLTAREQAMKGRGGTCYNLLMLLSCACFQFCKTGAGFAGSWGKRRQSSPGNMRELSGGVSGGPLGDGKVYVLPQNSQRL